MAEDFGIVEPLAPGVWRWPYAKMADGDSFSVMVEDRPPGKVKAHAYAEGRRLGCKFSVRTEGDFVTVTRHPADAQLKMGRPSNPILEGGDGEDYLGVLVPYEGGRFHWPIGTMEPGQYFHVNHDDRAPERVRNLVMARAAQEGIPLSVTASDPDMPHHAKVEYVKHGRRLRKNEPDSPDMLWEKMHKHLERYGVHLGTLDIWSGRETFVPIDWNEKPPLEWYSISGADGEIDHVIQITDEGIRGWMVKKGTTVKQFLANRETFDIFESQKKRMDKQQEERERAILMEKMRKDIEKEAAARLMED